MIQRKIMANARSAQQTQSENITKPRSQGRVEFANVRAPQRPRVEAYSGSHSPAPAPRMSPAPAPRRTRQGFQSGSPARPDPGTDAQETETPQRRTEYRETKPKKIARRPPGTPYLDTHTRAQAPSAPPHPCLHDCSVPHGSLLQTRSMQSMYSLILFLGLRCRRRRSQLADEPAARSGQAAVSPRPRRRGGRGAYEYGVSRGVLVVSLGSGVRLGAGHRHSRAGR